MARWLGPFTPSTLAEALHVAPELGDQFVKALLFHRLAHDTGDVLPTGRGLESVYEMDPLPNYIYNREKRTPPEVVAVIEMGGFELFNPRGMPVRIRTERDTRRVLSTPGAGRKMRLAEKQWQRQEEERARRARMPQKEPKWKRRKKGGAAITIIEAEND